MAGPFAPKLYFLIQNNNGPKLLSMNIGLNFGTCEHSLSLKNALKYSSLTSISMITGWSERTYPCASTHVLLHRIRRLLQRRHQLLRQTGEVPLVHARTTVLGAVERGYIHMLTRLHSSRMHATRLLAVSPSMRCSGGCLLRGWYPSMH